MADRHNVVITPIVEERFWAKVDRRGPDECWPWIGATKRSGYSVGAFFVPPNVLTAPQAALMVDGRQRPPPPSDNALHSCDNPNCVNPAHLRWGSHRENMDDRTARRGNYTRRGVKTTPKLTADQVRYVLSSPKTGRKLAAELGVHFATISDIRRGVTWRDIGSGYGNGGLPTI